MQSPADSAIGFPSRSTSAVSMLLFVMPADASSSLKGSSNVAFVADTIDRLSDRNSSEHRGVRPNDADPVRQSRPNVHRVGWWWRSSSNIPCIPGSANAVVGSSR